MVSISQINSTDSINYNYKQNQAVKNKLNQCAITNSNALEVFLGMMGKNNAVNLRTISFGSGVETLQPKGYDSWVKVGVPKDGTWIPDNLKEYICVESQKRIGYKVHTPHAERVFEASNGEPVMMKDSYPWPKTENINAWMVSAETQNFMSVGGLAQVAVDLPNSFNKKYKDSPDNKMTIVTPMYLNESEDGTNKLFEQDGQLIYKYKNKEMPVTKTATIKVPIFDEWKNGGEVKKVPVDVYVGTLDGSKYIMFDQKKVFNIDPSNSPKNANCAGCYVQNTKGFGEAVRFAFFSKCVYEYMKNIKEKPEKFTEKAPNIVIMNDWHVGSLAPMMKYLAPCEADHKQIKKETFDYFNEIPTLYIIHNLEHQGRVYNDYGTDLRPKVLGTMFGEYAKNIAENSFTWPDSPNGEKNALFSGKDADVNQAMMGLSLADRVVPVSEHYGDEILEAKHLSYGMKNLLRARNFHNTFAPITNGYSKSNAEPTEAHIKSVLKNTVENDVKDLDLKDVKLKPYTSATLTKVKPENKKEIFRILGKILERERESEQADWHSLDVAPDRKYMIYKPKDTDLSNIKDINKVPVMTFVGRVAEQKGMHNIFKTAYLQLAREYTEDQQKPFADRKFKNWDIPVIIAGGTVTDMYCYKELEAMKRELRDINPEFANRFILFKGFCNTNLLALGSDFFMIPSNFEPCGLVQMEVMPKGVLPIATATGGLVSTITPYKTGFLSSIFFDSGVPIYKDPKKAFLPNSNEMGYKDALENALHTYFEKPKYMIKMQKTAMQLDFSWDAPGGALEKYEQLMRTGKCNERETTIHYKQQPDAKNTSPFTNVAYLPKRNESKKAIKKISVHKDLSELNSIKVNRRKISYQNGSETGSTFVPDEEPKTFKF